MCGEAMLSAKHAHRQGERNIDDSGRGDRMPLLLPSQDPGSTDIGVAREDRASDYISFLLEFELSGLHGGGGGISFFSIIQSLSL